jgi:hypothetical protein
MTDIGVMHGNHGRDSLRGTPIGCPDENRETVRFVACALEDS